MKKKNVAQRRESKFFSNIIRNKQFYHFLFLFRTHRFPTNGEKNIWSVLTRFYCQQVFEIALGNHRNEKYRKIFGFPFRKIIKSVLMFDVESEMLEVI